MRSDDVDATRSERAGTDAAPIDGDLIVRPSDLRAGDILLYRSAKPNIVSRKISEVTGSPYTHASIYVGDGKVAESNPPGGVKLHPVEKSIKGSRCVAVLRSQMKFDGARPGELEAFVKLVLGEGRFYDLAGAFAFKGRSRHFFDRQLEIIREGYGKVATAAEYAQRSFFCSAFVVACYAAVKVIGDTAQPAYEPDAFSPGHLAGDPTFGWLLGFLVPEGGSVAADDPVLAGSMLWRDAQELRWW